MRKLSLSASKILCLLGLVSIHSLALTHVVSWREVKVECPAPYNDPFILKCAGYYDFTTDDDFSYWRGEKVLGADPKSFEMINRYYAKDKNYVFHNFEGTYRSHSSSGMPGFTQRQARLWTISTTHDEFWEVMYLADPKTFKVHPEDNEYSYDQNYLYHKGLLIGKTDGASLERLNEEYIRTNDEVFSYNQLLPQADADSFIAFVDKRQITEGKSKAYDNNAQPGPVTPSLSVDMESFQFIDARSNIFKDKDHVYYEDKIIKNADPNTFQILSSKSKYAKDKSNIFWLDRLHRRGINADVNTFEVDGTNPKWAKDQYSVFYEGYKQEKLDVKTFEILGGNYVRDHANIYFAQYSIKAIAGIDSNSFSIIDNKDFEKVNAWNEGNHFARDRSHVYYKENSIDKADPETFKILDKYGNFAADKNNTYIKKDDVYQIIKNANRETFALTRRGFDAEDKNYIYSSKGEITLKDKIVNCDCSSKKVSTDNKNSDRFIQLEYEGKYPDKYNPEESEDWVFNDFFSPYKYSRTGKYQIATQYWKNSKNVTYKKNYLPNVDIKSFEVIDIEFGKDNQYVYYQDKLIEGADADSFVVLDGDYSRDKNQLFYQQNKAIDLTKENYSEKPYRHYHGGALLKWVYSDELEVYHHKPYAKVGNHVFYENKVINGMNASTFYPANAPYKYHDERTQLSDIYSRDENYIYYKTERVEGADPNSFIVTEVPSSNPRYRVPIKAKDKFACYEEAKHVECK